MQQWGRPSLARLPSVASNAAMTTGGRWTLGLAACAVALLARPALSQAPAPAEVRAEPSRPTPALVVVNSNGAAWSGTVCASVPWPVGAVHQLDHVRVGDDLAPCRTLLRWPDGSVAVTQAFTRVEVAAGARAVLSVAPATAAELAADVGEAGSATAFDQVPALRSVVEDPFGSVFIAELVPDARAGAGGWSFVSDRVRVRRFASRHSPRGAGPEFLGLRAELVEFVGERRAVLTLRLDNCLAGAAALGPVRFRSWHVESHDPALRFRPRFIRENLLEAPTPLHGEDGALLGFRQPLLGPSDQLYLGDRTAKAVRFDLFLEGPDVTEDDRHRARLGSRVAALPELDWTRSTRAFGSHGGPGPAPRRPEYVERALVRVWRHEATFGPFGDFGDPKDGADGPSLRHGPSHLHAVVSLASEALLRRAESIVLQHPLRPTPGHAARRPAAWKSWRQGMSDRVQERPHGFGRMDYEHLSVDLLFDYYWLTGDGLARDELERVGTGIAPLLAGLPFETSRGEGWVMQAAVAIARATGDRDLVEAVRTRFVREVLPRLGGPQASYAIHQPPHALAFGPTDDRFDAPWQMAALVHGLTAVWRETADERLAHAIVATAELMATRGWVDGVGPKYFMSATDPGRYRMAVGYEPLQGPAKMLVGAFVLAREVAVTAGIETDKSLMASRADAIVEAVPPTEVDELTVDPWFQLYLDRHR